MADKKSCHQVECSTIEVKFFQPCEEDQLQGSPATTPPPSNPPIALPRNTAGINSILLFWALLIGSSLEAIGYVTSKTNSDQTLIQSIPFSLSHLQTANALCSESF